MKKAILTGFIFCLLLPAVFSAEEVSLSQAQMTEQAIRDRVKVLRQERVDTMPYLDYGHIRATINPKNVREKVQFLNGPEKNLNELIQRAVRVYSPARTAQERIALARRRILAALRKLFPEAKLEYKEQEGALSSAGFNAKSYRFALRQPVFRGGILWNTLLKEKAGLDSSEKDYDKAIEDVVNDVAKAYFDYNRTLRAIEDQNDAIERMRVFAEQSKKKHEQNIISEIEHLNVQSLFSQMQYEHENSMQELELAKLELQKFLDLEMEDEITVAPLYHVEDLLTNSEEKPGDSEKDSEVKAVNGDAPALDKLVDLAYENRPELQVEAAKLQSARLDEKIKTGELIPHADLILEFGRAGEAFNVNDPHAGLKREFTLGVELNWNAGGNNIQYKFQNDEQAPSVSQFLGGSGTQITENKLTVGLLDGLDKLVEAKEAEVERLNQVVELEKAEKDMIHDVKQAYFDFQKAKIQLESVLKRVDYRDRLRRLNAHRLGKNEVQISEYIEAEIALLKEKIELHKALKDYFTAKAQLNRAIGIRNYLPIEELYGK